MSKLKEKLGKEKYNQFLELLKDTDIKENNVDLIDGYVPRSRLNEVTEKLKVAEETIITYKTQVDDTKKLLSESEKFKEESESFKAKYSDLENKFNSEIENKNKEIENVTKRSLVKEQLIQKGARYPDLLLKEINFDEVVIKENKLFGFDDTMKQVEEAYKDMFSQTVNTPATTSLGNNFDNNNDGDEFAYLDAIE